MLVDKLAAGSADVSIYADEVEIIHAALMAHAESARDGALHCYALASAFQALAMGMASSEFGPAVTWNASGGKAEHAARPRPATRTAG